MGSTDNELKPDPAQTAEFLNNLPGAATETIVAIEEGGRLRAKSYPHGSGARVAADLAPVQGRANCYWHVNELRPGFANKKAKRSDVARIRMLHVDIDDLAGIDRLLACPTPPSVTIFSGGGYQAFWLLAEASEDIDLAEQLNRRLAQALGGDNCHNADRLMRLPGTLNVPNAKKRANGRVVALAYIVRELTDYARRYAIDSFDPGAPPAPPAAALPAPAESFKLSRLSDYTIALIRNGDDLAHPLGSANAAYPSRSEVLFRVTCDLVRAGADKEVIVAVLTDPANPISRSVLEQRNPWAYALRQSVQALRAVGDGWPNVNRAHLPVPSFANAQVALVRLGLKFTFDAFRNRKLVNSVAMQELAGELSDDLCMVMRNAILARFGFDARKEHIHDAAQALCLENAFNPVLDYLNGLSWDGTERAATWLTTYLGAEDTPLHQAMGRLVLMAAVRRVRKPGVKFDTMLVLEGVQGSGKSQAISILAGEEYFSDQEILAVDPKAQMEALEGVWLYEVSELQGIHRAALDKVKAFVSRSFDRGRPAYARFPERRPRQSVFIGTTNDEQWLRDMTGNRRFWPVKTGRIDLAALRRDRDQLWAEAAALEAQGGSLALAEDLWPDVTAAQDARLLDDPWLDKLADLKGAIEAEVEKISTSEILERLTIPIDRRDGFAAKRLVPLMRKLGWLGPTSLRLNGKVIRGYQRPAPGEADRQGNAVSLEQDMMRGEREF